MPAAIAEVFRERFGLERVLEYYGMTEIGIVTMIPWDAGRAGSCGVAVSERHEMHVGELVEPARVGDPFFGPEFGDDVHAFLEAGATLLHAHPEDFELFRDEGPPEAHVQPAVAQVVEHGQLSGQFHGIVEGRDHRTGDGPQAPGASGDRREEHHRVRRMPAILVEVVLHGLDGVVPQLVGTLGETQTLGEVLRRGVVAEAERREEVETEPHRYAPFRASSR